MPYATPPVLQPGHEYQAAEFNKWVRDNWLESLPGKLLSAQSGALGFRSSSVASPVAVLDPPSGLTTAMLSFATGGPVWIEAPSGGGGGIDRIYTTSPLTGTGLAGDPIVLGNLFASRITGGIFDSARIPNLNANKINAGVFDVGRIPSLPTVQITSGVFDLPRIPNLPAAQITSGVFDVGRIPSLPTVQITNGVFDDARIPPGISRDTERLAAIANMGLAVDNSGNVFLRTDGSGAGSIHLSTAGGGYAYVDPRLDGNPFDSVAGQIRFGGADNSDRAGWYLAVEPQAGASRGQIPADVNNDYWIRLDNDVYPNIGGGQTERLTSLLFRHPSPANAESRLYTIDPIATDAQAVDDQGASRGNPYIYTPFQLASVVAAHQSPTHSLPHLAMLPTTNVGDLALLDHDYTQGNRRDAEVTFNTLGAAFHGWSDGSVFGRSGTSDRNLSPLQFIRLQYNGSVYTESQIGSTNRSWIDRLDKFVSDNTEYALGPTTTSGGHFVRAIISGPNSANISPR